MSKSEALRLADELDAVPETGADPDLIQESAAELRRLHAQRDALLEALRLMMDCAGVIATAPDSMLEMALTDDDEETRRQANAFLVARATIKAVEETK